MSFSDVLEKITDPYERKARLFPALLALSPAIISLSAIYFARVSALSHLLALIASCGLLYLISNVSRELGKRVEETLFNEWGGKPSTQLLRHRDTTIDRVTKGRYHKILSQRTGITFPSPEEEKVDPSHADDIYKSAVIWLLGQTRDTKRFGLLLNENIAYGFRRNALGLKPISIVISIITLVLLALKYKLIAEGGLSIPALEALPDVAIISISATVIMLLTWILFFTKYSVRSAATTYAETLLRACDDASVNSINAIIATADA